MNAPERIGQDELRTIQMGLLREFARQCDALGIPWFVTGGTLLGAVRHQGYIPWDDDLDVMMMRPDYERFCARFVDGPARLASAVADRAFAFPFAKMYAPGTRVVEHYDPMPTYGVHIDIFPVDGWARLPLLVAPERVLVKLLRLLLGARIVQPAALQRRSARCLVRVARVLLRPVRPSTFGRLLTRVVARDPAPGGRCGIIVWGGAESVRTEAFRAAVSLSFEGVEVPGPAGWDECLAAYYGDYMRLPPEAERVGHPFAVPYRVET